MYQRAYIYLDWPIWTTCVSLHVESVRFVVLQYMCIYVYYVFAAGIRR